MIRLTAYVSGKVQKTGFRARALSIARDFNLKGYVQNLDDGRVKVVAEGENYDVESLLAALDIKNTLISVADIRREYGAATGEFQGFFKAVSGGETDQRLDQAAQLLKELIVVNKDVVKEIRATREELRDEIRATRDDLKAEIGSVRDEVKSSGDMIAERIDSAREEIAGKIDDLHSDLKDDCKERLVKIEDDVSQIKARISI